VALTRHRARAHIPEVVVSRGVVLLFAGAAVGALGVSLVAVSASDTSPTKSVTTDSLAFEVLAVSRPSRAIASIDLNQHEHLAHLKAVAQPENKPSATVTGASADKQAPEPNREAETTQAAAAATETAPDGPSPTGSLGIPERAMSAYRAAADGSGSTCNLEWQVIAAIGRAESGHANGGQLYPDGLTWQPILGPVLDGSPFAAIADTDGGRLDGDNTWDRAVGPMQFLPGTWQWIGVDGDGNGTADPNDIDDAAAGTARYLCAHGGDLTERPALRTAVLRYNDSGAYADAVLAWADGYAGRASVVADPPSPAKPEEKPAEKALTAEPKPVKQEEKQSAEQPTEPEAERPAATADPVEADPVEAEPVEADPVPSAQPLASAEPTPTAQPSPSEATATPTPTPDLRPTPTPTETVADDVEGDGSSP
jgi:membrane-bound lytic murein transglycosylase B